MASYEDLVRQQKAKLAATQRANSGKPIDLSGFGGGGGKDSGPMAPVNTLLDILSRPLNMITETGEAVINAMTPKADEDRIVPKTFWDYAGDIVTAPGRGLFMPGDENRMFTGKLIEQATDRFGAQYNPSYVDREDNVNPVAKGIAGFAGDVLLDPLTYTGVGAIKSIGSAAARAGAKAAGAAGKVVDSVRTARAGEEGVAAAAESAGRAERGAKLLDEIEAAENIPTPAAPTVPPTATAAPVAPAVARAVEEAVDAPAVPSQAARAAEEATPPGALGDLPEGGAPAPRAAEASPAQPTPLGAGFLQEMQATARANKAGATEARKMLGAVSGGGLAKDVRQGMVELTPVQRTQKARDLNERYTDYFYGGMDATGAESKLLKNAPSGALRWKPTAQVRQELSAATGIPANQIPAVISPAALGDLARGQSPQVAAAITRFLLRNTSTKAGQAELFKVGVPTKLIEYAHSLRKAQVDDAGKITDGVPVASRFEAFQARVSQDRAAVESALGAPLTKWLSEVHPDRFDAVTKSLSKILNKDGFDTWAAQNPDLVRRALDLMDHLGVGAARSDAMGSITVVRELMLEAAQGGRLKTTMDRVLGPVLGRNFTDAEATFPTQVKPGVRREGESPEVHDARRMGEAHAALNTDMALRMYKQLFPGKSGTKKLRSPYHDELVAAANAYRTSGDIRPGGKTGPIEHIDEVFGETRARAVADVEMKIFRDLSDAADAIGYRQFISQPGRYSKTFNLSGQPIAMSLSDVYGVLHGTAREKGKEHLALLTLFSKDASVSPTALQGTVARAIEQDTVDVDELARLLADTTPSNSSRGAVRNNLSGAVLPDLRHIPLNGRPLPERLKGKVKMSPGGRGYWMLRDGDEVRRELAELITDSDVLTALRTRAAENAANYAARFGKETHLLATDELKAIDGFVGAADRAGAVRSVLDARKNARQRANENGMMPAAAETATDLVEGAIGKAALDVVHATARAESAVATANTAADVAAATKSIAGTAARNTARESAEEFAESGAVQDLKEAVRLSDELDDEAVLRAAQAEHLIKGEKDRVAEVSKIKDADARNFIMGVGAYRNLQRTTQSIFDPFRKLFDQSYGMERINAMRSQVENVAGYHVARVARSVDALSRKYPFTRTDTATESIWNDVYDAVRRGEKPADPKLAGAYDDLTKTLSSFLPMTRGGGLMANVAYVNGDTALLERLMKENGLDDIVRVKGGGPLFDMDAAKAAAKLRDPEKWRDHMGEELAQQWRTWDVKNPLEFAKRYANVVMTASEYRALSANFTEFATTAGLASKTPQPGFVRISVEGKSNYGAFVDKDLYFDKDLAKELAFADNFSMQPKQAQARLVKDYYIPMLQTWKFGITQLRPGHHIRNFVGDASITYVARGTKNYMQSHNQAISILVSRKNYRDIDATKALQGIGLDKSPKGGDVIARGEKYGTFTVDEIYEAAMERGLMPSVYVGEDLFMEGEQVVSKFANIAEKVSLRNTKVGRFAGDISEYRDHYARMHHFVQAIHQEAAKGKFATKAEMFDKLSAEVRKYHPDASMLSNFETKYMRLIIPFYSWFRGILPAIAESSLRYPARVMTFPKASYNLALANGMNPETIANPYDDREQYPSFITEQAFGPQMKIGDNAIIWNPGFAHMDVFNSLGADPFREILGMTSPIFRVPMEIASGGSWSTGGRIADTSDYLDSTIPGLNYVASISGVSPTGTLAGLLSGQGVDMQRGQSTGSKGPLDQALSGWNWLSGSNLTNIDRQNFLDYAEIEKRDAAREDSK